MKYDQFVWLSISSECCRSKTNSESGPVLLSRRVELEECVVPLVAATAGSLWKFAL